MRSSPGTSGVPAIPNATTYTFGSPNRGAAALQERAAAQTMAGNPAAGRPHLAYLNSASRGAIETLDRVAQASQYTPTVVYPNNGFAQSLRTVAGAIVRGIGSRVYWVPTGGYDTHAGQGGGGGGAYANLMGTLGDGLGAFYSDIRNQGLASGHDHHRVLGVQPAHVRERQRGHRSRSGGRDDGARRLGARRALRNGAAAIAGHIQRSKTTPGMCATRPTSGPCTRECSTSGSV